MVKQIQTGKGAHNFRAVGDKRHLFLTNRVSGSISIIDQQTLSKVGDITGLLPGPDDMELTADGGDALGDVPLGALGGADRCGKPQAGQDHPRGQVAARHLLPHAGAALLRQG